MFRPGWYLHSGGECSVLGGADSYCSRPGRLEAARSYQGGGGRAFKSRFRDFFNLGLRSENQLIKIPDGIAKTKFIFLYIAESQHFIGEEK